MIAPLLDLFAKITHKGDKINLDPGTVSLKSLLPREYDNDQLFMGLRVFSLSRGYAELLHLWRIINNTDVLWKCSLDCFSRTYGSIKTSSKSIDN